MSAMANTTPLVTTVTKPATNLRDADATPRVNIQEFCEEYYEDILPIIMTKFAMTDKKMSILGRVRSTDLAKLTRQAQPNLDPVGHFFRDHPRGRSRPHWLNTSNEDCPKDRERFRSVGESYDDSFSHSFRDGNRSRHMKRRMDYESPLSSMSKSDSSDGRYRKSRSKRHKSMDEDDLTRPWMCEEEERSHLESAAAQMERWAMPTWCHMFNSTLIGATRVWFDELLPESIDSYKDLKVAFLAYFMQQKKYVKDLVEIHNIKQKDGETTEDFMERFKVETGRMKGAPECMWISRFMHGVNNPKLTKRLNEHVPKTMEEIMIATTAFIRGEAAAASKKKAHEMLKFPIEGGIVTIRSTILIPNKCTSVITSSAVSKKEMTRPDNFKVALHPDFPDQEVAIEGTLSEKGRTELCSILKNLDIFAWKSSDMTGVPRSVAEHRLNIRDGYSHVRQKKKGQAPKRAKAIQAEVQKLVEAGIMGEVYYHDWLSNPIMVKKHDGSWQMCVDFTDLNKACPHDCYLICV
nr:reverse transcriptase domain-containing protein [Tanacetum cinerariifolium]